MLFACATRCLQGNCLRFKYLNETDTLLLGEGVQRRRADLQGDLWWGHLHPEVQEGLVWHLVEKKKTAETLDCMKEVFQKTGQFFMRGFYLDRFLVWLHSFENLVDIFWQWICEGCKLRDANVDVTHCGECRRSKFTTTARARFIQIYDLQNCYKGRMLKPKKFTSQLKIDSM